ncbi:glycosyltransferase family 2 protein [Alkalitalea saponilacus]|uniref:Glycosyltransferase involved in cell wall bisynthesis n=1 Tax=Alkalitalea saponilacus TaxID=889453 RepID=A0A1T5H000_9BACT|nr:glycosyltransferase family 2 protein [Alkalitalea saponilacus]ASB50958.1 hypothetical protein CDL62_18300 [Alkalitalea saponilacus]SKC13984.1 Glycosyltransferase involved in cell wall bisynthesis [Alkalitalea saponilacus]
MDSTTPLISVLMTVYNREKYISEAIESVISSTYQNWELIIVDDQSKDRSVEIARSYEAKDNRIKVYVNEKNLGQFPNRNKAASLAIGEYIKYLDSDDIIYPHGLEVMVSSIEKFPNAGVAICQSSPDIKQPYPLLIDSKNALIEHFNGTKIFNAGPSSCIFNKDAFNYVNGFRIDNYVGNDTLLFLDIAKYYPVLKIPNALIWWRRHEGQEFINGQNSNTYFIFDFNKQVEFILDPEINFSKNERKKLFKSYFNMRIGQIISKAFKNGKFILSYKAFIVSRMNLAKLLYKY